MCPTIRAGLLIDVMDLKIKTFHIHSAEDERALNEFLAGKSIRH